ncbi:MAG: NAD(P)-binding domain-containing protein [Planctomycetota bacterium]|nr:NAD(P)-binding domain-containing protein [Planctomycetota bacterium]
MVSALLALLGVLLGLRRRAEVRDYARSHSERLEAKARGSDRARLQHPHIDLSQCFGCGACVRACPEEGVLSLLHGQAVVLHGARCVGHGACASACPMGAIALTLGDLKDRRDIPALDEELEAVGQPGLFLAGELGGFALVRTAVSQGVAVADAIARRLAQQGKAHVGKQSAVQVTVQGSAPSSNRGADEPLDLLVVGAGPGGIACSLRAKERGIAHRVIEQAERIGGTVAAYPRRKMVMTQPMELPLHGRLPRLTYEKEDLVELWGSLVTDHQLPVRTGVRLEGLRRLEDGTYEAATTAGVLRARNVCLALGRRGSPRKLDVPGEDLPKVSYSLLDAESYRDRRILVVGGGDSAIEAALALADQPGNTVTLVYRQKSFFRLKARNDKRLAMALEKKRLVALMETQVERIERDRVHLLRPPAFAETGQASSREAPPTEPMILPNDEVFIFAGGQPPFEMLAKVGVSFDPKDRPKERALAAGGGLLPALVVVLLCSLAMLVWVSRHRDYYNLAAAERVTSDAHAALRPSGQTGLALGLAATVLLLANLAYLARRSAWVGRFIPGSLRAWMGSHVLTGLVAFLAVLTHAGFSFRDTVGGHALIAFTIVVATGLVGRYFYAFVPRAANGTEVDLDDVRAQLATLSGQWDRAGRGFGHEVRQQIEDLMSAGRWRPGMFGRIAALVSGQVRLRAAISRLRRQGQREGIPADEITHLVGMSRRAYRLTLLVTHYEEVRAILSSWRYFHRWLALLLVLLTGIHIATAMRFGELGAKLAALFAGGRP